MAPRPIAFLDSGVGGLPYLVHARRSLPGERFVYAADSANFPYGEMGASRIVDAAIGVTERLLARENPRLVVVACNTMSVVALGALRARFPVPFVGVVPAVKPAAESSRSRRVGVLATRQTVEGEYLRGLIESHAAGCVVVSLPAAGLVEFVEQDLYRSTGQERAGRVAAEVARFRDARIDTLVLGCTHFLHLEPEFRSCLDGAGIALVDSREGVVRQVARLAAAGRRRPGEDGHPERGPVVFYVTGEAAREERYRWFADRFDLRLEGSL
jgi:glutamate racemase